MQLSKVIEQDYKIGKASKNVLTIAKKVSVAMEEGTLENKKFGLELVTDLMNIYSDLQR